MSMIKQTLTSLPGLAPAGIGLMALLLAASTGCGSRRELTDRDRQLCIRATDFHPFGWNITNCFLIEKYTLDHRSAELWTVKYTCKGFDEETNMVFNVEFSAQRGGSATQAGWEDALARMQWKPGWERDLTLINHTHLQFAFQHVLNDQTNATATAWLENGRLFTLSTVGIPILSADEFDQLIRGRTNAWAIWEPGSATPTER